MRSDLAKELGIAAADYWPRRFAQFLILTLLAIQIAATAESVAASQPPESLRHNWGHVTYPYVLSPTTKAGFRFVVGYGNKEQGLRLDIHSGPQPRGETSLLLVHENGKTESPIENNLRGGVGVTGKASTPPTWFLMVHFPWAGNRMEAAWIEISISRQRYWLEIPYGFTRDPKLPIPPSQPGGEPQFPPGSPGPRKEQLVHWEAVHYELGEIENSWRLFLIQSNPFDASSEVVLYRERSRVGDSFFMELHSPLTSVRILDTEGEVIKGYGRSIRLHEDGMRRSDIFKFARNGDFRRTWGLIEISVADTSYRQLVPSSLYRYCHGASGHE